MRHQPLQVSYSSGRQLYHLHNKRSSTAAKPSAAAYARRVEPGLITLAAPTSNTSATHKVSLLPSSGTVIAITSVWKRRALDQESLSFASLQGYHRYAQPLLRRPAPGLRTCELAGAPVRQLLFLLQGCNRGEACFSSQALLSGHYLCDSYLCRSRWSK